MRTTLFVLALLFCAAFAVQDFEKFTPAHFLKSIRVKNNTRNLDSYVETALIPTRDGINLFNSMLFFPSGASPAVYNTILIRTPYSAELVTPLYAALGQPGFAIVIQVFLFLLLFLFCFVLLVFFVFYLFFGVVVEWMMTFFWGLFGCCVFVLFFFFFFREIGLLFVYCLLFIYSLFLFSLQRISVADSTAKANSPCGEKADKTPLIPSNGSANKNGALDWLCNMVTALMESPRSWPLPKPPPPRD